MKNGQKIDLAMSGYDELFMTDEERVIKRAPHIVEIPLDQIDDFPDHPFKVRMDEDMDQLVESVKERGLITPITVRPKDGGRYEIVSGHRRRMACELAGITAVKADVRNLSRDEAIIMMVESNLQRSVILPSEKAFSYKMRLEAMKWQGKRTDLTSSPVETKLRSSEIIAQLSGDSRSQIDRYIRLTELIPGLLELVDEGRMAMRPAVEISYLTKKEQEWLLTSIEFTECTPSHAQAIRMRAHSKDGTLGRHVIENIMEEEKPNQVDKISLRYDDARKYIPSHIPYNKTREYIMQALAYYQQHNPERGKKDKGSR